MRWILCEGRCIVRKNGKDKWILAIKLELSTTNIFGLNKLRFHGDTISFRTDNGQWKCENFRNLHFAPYLSGYWISDGSSDCSRFNTFYLTCIDDSSVHLCLALLQRRTVLNSRCSFGSRKWTIIENGKSCLSSKSALFIDNECMNIENAWINIAFLQPYFSCLFSIFRNSLTYLL